jgi:hypothetical protein
MPFRCLRPVLGALSLLGAAATTPRSAGAQHLPVPFASLHAEAPAAIWTLPPAKSDSQGDFRWLGTAIGAVSLGLVAGLEASAYCGNSENGPRDCTGLTIGIGLLGAAAGGTLGHFIGRAIPRH